MDQKRRRKTTSMSQREERGRLLQLSKTKMVWKTRKQSPKKGINSHRKRNGIIIRVLQLDTPIPELDNAKLSNLEQVYMDISREASTTADEVSLITPPKES